LCNKDQIEAVKYAIDNLQNDFYRLIIGPPGTGKTLVGTLLMVILSQGTDKVFVNRFDKDEDKIADSIEDLDHNWGCDQATSPILVLATNNHIVDKLLTSVSISSGHERWMDAFDNHWDLYQMDEGIIRIGGFSKMTSKYQLFAEGKTEPDLDRLHELVSSKVKHVLEAGVAGRGVNGTLWYTVEHVSLAAKITGMIIAETQDDSVELDELEGSIGYLIGDDALLQAKIDEALRALELLNIRKLAASGSLCCGVCACVCVFCLWIGIV
jgi:hypothetical protein